MGEGGAEVGVEGLLGDGGYVPTIDRKQKTKATVGGVPLYGTFVCSGSWSLARVPPSFSFRDVFSSRYVF